VLHEDAEIIKQVLGGNPNAYATLVDRYKSMVFTLAYRFLKNRENAEEAAQDAFISAYKSLAGFRQDSKFSTWLYRIVYNQCANTRRKRSVNIISVDDENAPDVSDEDFQSITDTIDLKDRKKIISQAMHRLGSDDAAIVTLFYYDDASVEEISQITRLSESNVKVKLYRARKKLYSLLSKMNESVLR
jgi:RNA polymerase sigma-70 factor (ECF subfamily)